MGLNPMIQQREFRQALHKKFNVVFVVKNIDVTKDSGGVQEYCTHEGIRFSIREFSPREFDEDCENIERLPAIHLYVDRSYQRTYYPNEDPVASTKAIIDKIAEEERLHAVKRMAWKNRFSWFSFPTIKRSRRNLVVATSID